jgi:hypothetical protein
MLGIPGKARVPAVLGACTVLMLTTAWPCFSTSSVKSGNWAVAAVENANSATRIYLGIYLAIILCLFKKINKFLWCDQAESKPR